MMTRDGAILWVMLSVGTGAAIGAMIRWLLSYQLNDKLWLPLGTLTANLVAGILIGVVVAWLSHNPSVSPLVRLFLITGFLGGLSTLSTFSVESLTLLYQEAYLKALFHMGVHILGTLMMTALGVAIGHRLFG